SQNQSNDSVELALTSSTVVTASRALTTGNVTARFAVVEYLPQFIKSAQRGSISLGIGAASANATITAVTTTKALLPSLRFTEGSVNSQEQPTLQLASSTSVNAARTTSVAAFTAGWQVIEFK